MATDREILKNQQLGALVTAPSVSDARAAIQQHHTIQPSIYRYGTENAATNVSEAPGVYVAYKSRLTGCKILPEATVANDTSDYVKVYVYKRDSAGSTQTLLASWNTHTSAQGAITVNVPAALTTVDNSDLVIDAGSSITYQVGKFGNGKVLAVFRLFPALEQV